MGNRVGLFEGALVGRLVGNRVGVRVGRLVGGAVGGCHTTRLHIARVRSSSQGSLEVVRPCE